MRILFATLLLLAAAQAEEADRLLDDDPDVRAAAAARLGDLGPAAAPAVPLLAEAAYDEDLLVARAAVDALGRIGPEAKEAAPLLRKLAAARPGFDTIVARALRRMGEGPGEPPASAPPRAPDPKAMETLAPLVDDARASVRMPAIWALAREPAADPIFLAMLGDPRVRRRRIAADHFFGPESLPRLRRALADEDLRVRRGVVRAIESLGARAEPALPDLLALLDEGDPYLAADLCRGVVAAGRGAPGRVVPALVRQITAPEAACRSAACSALGQLGEHAAPAVPALIDACFDDQPQVRSDATGALRALGRVAKEAAPFLAEIADADPEGELARLALQAVGGGSLPPPPDPLDIASLRTDLAGSDARAAGRAALTLGRVGARDALDALGAALDHPAPRVRRHAALALLRIGPANLPVLARAPPGRARRAATAVLPRLAATEPGAVLPVALAFARDDDPAVRREAMRAVGIIGPAAREAAATLLEHARGGEGTAVWALGRLQAAEAVPLLVELLSRPAGDESRVSTLMALAAMGPAAEPALPALVAEARRPDDAYFATVLDALVRIGAPGQAEVVKLVRDEQGLNRSHAIQLLMALGLRPPGLAEALDVAAKDPDSNVRQTALLAAKALGAPRDGVDKLVAAARAEPADRFRWSHLPETLAEVATVAELLAVARDKEAQVRWIAWSALSRKRRADFTGEDAAQALPLLLEALAEPGVSDAAAVSAHVVPLGPPDPALLRFLVPPPVREINLVPRRYSEDFDAYAAEQVGKAIHDLGPEAVPALAQALAHEDARIRAGAAVALGRFGRAARAAVPPLVEAARAEPERALPFVRAIAAAADLETIATLLADAGMPARSELADALVAAGKDALPLLDALRRHDEPAIRRDAVNLFPRCPAVPPDWIVKATGDEDDGVACAAIAQLGRGVPAERAVPALERAARDDALRTTALRALVARGDEALPALRGLATDESPAVRAATLGALGPALPGTFGLAAEGLKDPDARVRTAAAVALGRLGPDAAAAIPALRAQLEDPDGTARLAAAVTLGRLQAEDAVPDLVRLFGSAETPDRRAAAQALAAIGAKGAEALAPFLSHPDATLRDLARSVLGGMGADAVPAVAARLATEDARTRREAAGVLAKIGAPAVDALRAALREKAARLDAAWALGSMKAHAKAAVPDLVLALEDKDPLVVAQAAWALGQIGPAASDALPALGKLRDARKHATIVEDAIRRIRGS